jgi:hypothetical protein
MSLKLHDVLQILNEHISLFSYILYSAMSGNTEILLRRNFRWWTISPKGIIRPVISVSALTWHIGLIYY